MKSKLQKLINWCDQVLAAHERGEEWAHRQVAIFNLIILGAVSTLIASAILWRTA